MNIYHRLRQSGSVRIGFYFFVLISVFGLLSSCATQRIKIYPDFNAQKQKINSMTIFCDYYVFDDVKGKVDLADVPRNLELAKAAMDILETQMSAKGYKTVGKDVISMGLYVKDTTKTFKIAAEKSPVSKEEIETLPEAPPPFYVNKVLFDTEEKLKVMEAVTKKLSVYQRKVGQPATTIPEAVQIQTGKNEDAFLFLFMQGRDVALGKTIGQAVATAILTLGLFSIAESSYTNAYIYMVDAKTGEIIWSDIWVGAKIAPSSPKFLTNTFKRMADNIPAK